MKYLPKLLATSAVCAFLTTACNTIPEIQEETTGPFVAVCVESFKPYTHTFELIDSLKNELKPLNVEIDYDFAIIYERRRQGVKPHSIVGSIIKTATPEDSAVIVKLIRNNFMVRTIGKTKSMVVSVPIEPFTDTDIRLQIIEKIDKYIKDNNYLQIPNGENGILELYKDKKMTIAAEIRPSK